MMNYVWLFLIAAAILTGAVTGNIENVTKSAIDMAGTAVDIAIGLIGIMTLWLGIMKIAQEAGIIQFIAKIIRPISRWLFADVPEDHPAIGAITLNIAANWLGLGNAATPFGIKAMEQLQDLNDNKDTATDAMIMFLGLNTASITLIPMTIIGVRTSLGSTNPTAIIGTTIFSSTIATLTAIFAVKLFAAFSNRQSGWGGVARLALKGFILLVAIFLFFYLAQKLQLFVLFSSLLPFSLKSAISFISAWAIPFLLFAIPIAATIKKVRIYEVFVEGAKEGFHVAVKIIPFLVAILAAIAMFRASGALDFLTRILSPLTERIGMPAEVVPAALLRPLSGSGTLGVITELLQRHGVDSFIGNLASTIYGCTETTFYVIAVYFGAVGIKKVRYSIAAGLIADAAGVLAAVYICRLLFL